MLRNVHRLKGLNLRDSDINREPDYARDLRNVEKNAKGEIRLRWGYDKVLDDPGIIDLFEYVGAADSPNRGKLLALKADGLYVLNGSTLDKINVSNNAQPTWTAQTKPVEYNKVLYWNDPSFDVDLWKFDGYTQYRAGVPAPSIVSIVDNAAGTAGDLYWRIIIKFTDAAGNITYSDYYSYAGNSTQVDITYNPIDNAYYDGFYSKRCLFSSPGTLQTINTGNPTVINITGHNYVAGDYALIKSVDSFVLSGRTELSGVKLPILISSVTATTITFDAVSLGTKDYVVNDAFEECLEVRWEIEAYSSSLEFSNYTKAGATASGALALNRGTSPIILSYVGGAGLKALNSVYDDSLVRVLPPKMKYLTIYNDFIVGAFLGKDNPDFGYASLLGNDTRLEDAIVWSDISTLNNGSSVETFLVNNIRPVGASEDGSISAINGNDDNIVVHKEKQSYYVNGDLVTNTLRIRKAMSEQIGAASHRSIKNVDGGHLYTSPKGVFLAGGGAKPVELSDIIQPLFTDSPIPLGTLELGKAKSVNDFINEKIYIYVPITGSTKGVILAYDYYYKEWFLHDNIPADQGFQDVGVNSSDIYFADSTSLYKRNQTVKTDNLVKIAGSYTTGWFDINAPSILKKFTNFILLSISNVTWKATIKGFCNWDSNTVVGSGDLNFTPKINVDDYKVMSVNANSVSFEIGNGTSGDDILITGYEVQFEETQVTPKGDT